MVAKMMRWRPWPPLLSKKFEVKLVVRRLVGLDLLQHGETEAAEKEKEKLAVEIRWKGQKLGLSTFKRTLKRNFTKEGESNGVHVEWDEEFQSVCTLSSYKDNAFLPWEVSFVVFTVGGKNKSPILGVTSFNLAEFASQSEQNEFELSLPIATVPDSSPMLLLFLSLAEIGATPEQSESVSKAIIPLSPSPDSCVDAVVSEKDDVSAIKAGLRKVKIFTEYVSNRKSEKASKEESSSEARISTRAEFGEYNFPFDSDSTDDVEDGVLVRKSISYESIAYANCAGVSSDDDGLIYYSNRKSDAGCPNTEEHALSPDQPSSIKGLLSWKKRKLSFRSSPKMRGEPLLKKAYAEEGGDDIDFDRRQLSPDSSLLEWLKNADDASAISASISEFGDDSFAVGKWEQREIMSRDGEMKLTTQVFFASIDQRSEKAAGESACTVLVAVIADWFQKNPNLMPIKSQFDSLIREGSKEWRSLCEIEPYRSQFPDKHFDLETVIQSKIRPLTTVPGKSFVGFFHPDGLKGEKFEFLDGAMSFDGIWEEIDGCERAGGDSHVYIVSWNDHFFVLKAESDAYYIVDTLGERLLEGGDQAFILRFDRGTVIEEVQEEREGEKREKGVWEGKGACKEYIKSFLAGIPIRELQNDVKKGLISCAPIHHRLQIEFHYTTNADDSDVDPML